MSRISERERDEWLAAVGQAIREFRNDLGISQKALGYRAGLHRTYVSDVERGRRDPTAATLLALARPLGTNPSEILRVAEKVLRKG